MPLKRTEQALLRKWQEAIDGIGGVAWFGYDPVDGAADLRTPYRNKGDFMRASGTREEAAVLNVVAAAEGAADLVRRGAPGEIVRFREVVETLRGVAPYGLEIGDLDRIEWMSRLVTEIRLALKGSPTTDAGERDQAALLAVQRRERKGEFDWTQGQIEDEIGAPRKSLMRRVEKDGPYRYPAFANMMQLTRKQATDRRTGRLPKR